MLGAPQMNVTSNARRLAFASTGFAALTALPFLMNAFPVPFSRAFSEHARSWSAASLTIMAAALVAWGWSALRLGREWRRWHQTRGRLLSHGRECLERPAPLVRALLILQGPILVALFYLMWLSARVSLGRWPSMGGMDDPKGIAGTSILYWTICVWFWFGALALAWPLFRTGTAVARRDGTAGEPVRDLVLTAALLFGSLIFISANPHDLFRWFLD